MTCIRPRRVPTLFAVLLLAILLGPMSGRALAEDDTGPVPGVAPGATPETDQPSSADPEPTKRRPLLWMVEGTPRMFLYGTIHVSDERVLKHLPVVRQALDQATALYTELAMDPAGMMEMQQAVLRRAPLPPGQTLTKLFGSELHARVAKCMPPGQPLALFDGFKPWLITFLITQAMISEYQQKQGEKALAEGRPAPNLEAQALDPMLFNEALAAGKQVGGLEKIDTQLDVFDSLPLDAQVQMVAASVEAIEKMRAAAASGDTESEDADPLGAMLDLWLAGDDAGFAKLFEEEIRKQGAEANTFVEGLLDNRNVGMAKEIQRHRLADPGKTYFFAVGAGHMPGEMGLVKLLEAEGLTVRRIELGEQLPALPKPASVPDKPAGDEPAGEKPAADKPAEKREPIGSGR